MTTIEERKINIESRRDWQLIANVIYMLFDLLEIAKKENKKLLACGFPRLQWPFKYTTYKTDFYKIDIQHCVSMLKNNNWNIINLKRHFIKHYIL